MRFTALVFLLVLGGCVHQPGRTQVLRYGDFGPQAAAYELIGYAWYQWNTQGPDDPRASDDVRVVVYDGLPLAEVKKLYPVVQAKEQDYRYLSFRDALTYIDNHSRELPHLLVTRKKIVSHFGYEK